MIQLLKRSLPLLVLLASAVNAQISIPTNTFNPTPGTVIQNKLDGSAGAAFFTTVTAGTGGPMTWDFTGHTFGSAISLYVVSLASTPAIDSFPGANLVLMYPYGADTAWTVHRSVSSSMFQMGASTRGSTPLNTLVYKDSAVDWVFPINYGNQWTAYRHWRTTSGSNYSKHYDTTKYNVNGWGNVKYGTKLVACLRVVATLNMKIETYNSSNVLLNTTTSTTTTVNFVAAGNITQAAVTKSTSSGFDFYSGYALSDFLSGPTGVDDLTDGNLPTDFTLEQNYPNPFNPRTVIRFDLPKRADVKLTVYNLAGQEVKVIANGEMGPGIFSADWDGTNTSGESVATGVYLYRLDAGSFTQTKKMVLMK